MQRAEYILSPAHKIAPKVNLIKIRYSTSLLFIASVWTGEFSKVSNRFNSLSMPAKSKKSILNANIILFCAPSEYLCRSRSLFKHLKTPTISISMIFTLAHCVLLFFFSLQIVRAGFDQPE